MKCIITSCTNEIEKQKNFCNTCWKNFPLKFKQKFWKETNFNKKKYSQELLDEANKCLTNY